MFLIPNHEATLQNLQKINRIEVGLNPQQCSCSNCTCSSNCSVTSFYGVKTVYSK